MPSPKSSLPPEFDDFDLTVPLDVHDPAVNSLANQNGLSDWQRFAAKNFFDTQPKRRAAYLKRLGYEMGKDGESYRPIGSDGNFEPLETTNLLGYLPYYNLFSETGRKELLADLKDIGFDVAVTGPAIGVGASVGGAAGAAKGAAGAAAIASPTGPGAAIAATLGGAIGGALGAFGGGTAGNVVSETIKTGIGNFLLDESVPLDLQETVYQSMVSGAMSGLGKNAEMIWKNWRKMGAKQIQDALKEAAVRKSNGTWNMELANDLAKNPQNYTPEAVKGANEKLLKLSDDIFGTSVETPKSTRELTGGVAKQAITPLNDRADLEIEKLAKLPEANFTVEEVIETLKARTEGLAKKKFKTQDEERALAFFNDEIKSLKAKTRVAEPEPSVIIDPATGKPFATEAAAEGFHELSFKEGRDLLKRWQNAAFEEGPVKGNGTVRQVTHGLKELADLKAGTVGSDLPGINAQRSKILQTYRNMQSLIKDGSMQAAYTGKDSLAKQRVRRMFEEVDQVMGLRLAEAAETTQFQAAVERLYNAPSAFGSGSVLADAMRQGLKEAPKEAFRMGSLGAAAGVPTGQSSKLASTAAAFGAVKGFARGLREGATFSSPDTLIRQFSRVKTRLDDLNRTPGTLEMLRSGVVSPVTAPISQAAAQLGPVTEPAPPVETAAPRPPAAAVLPPEFDDFDLKLPEGL